MPSFQVDTRIPSAKSGAALVLWGLSAAVRALEHSAVFDGPPLGGGDVSSSPRQWALCHLPPRRLHWDGHSDGGEAPDSPGRRLLQQERRGGQQRRDVDW
eukprot:CAMPEP_0174385690 /NCGR_PEP_ID=MMETSP0811_2-20130205/126771_1 /TAXON_ID=73025 ORGANISM="Eutreptiella gymnastica-like, Strain CCMP1594" /NCGR_SAMPLE_ID=MMETSP0811_2 /ASSEMBLY_ACC=CAM_ASM_000667 /LENGTH=99 /DNA_ID=CAMNT_0015540105 /DNA_START=587 /DNA_END=883 /DNA_ORIENTATION=-